MNAEYKVNYYLFQHCTYHFDRISSVLKVNLSFCSKEDAFITHLGRVQSCGLEPSNLDSSQTQVKMYFKKRLAT